MKNLPSINLFFEFLSSRLTYRGKDAMEYLNFPKQAQKDIEAFINAFHKSIRLVGRVDPIVEFIYLEVLADLCLASAQTKVGLIKFMTSFNTDTLYETLVSRLHVMASYGRTRTLMGEWDNEASLFTALPFETTQALLKEADAFTRRNRYGARRRHLTPSFMSKCLREKLNN